MIQGMVIFNAKRPERVRNLSVSALRHRPDLTAPRSRDEENCDAWCMNRMVMLDIVCSMAVYAHDR